MATKLWVNDALQILAESFAPVPHELNELDWKHGSLTRGTGWPNT